MSFRALCYTLAVALVGVDQATKALASANLSYGEPLVVLPFFNLTLLHNTGAAFSFLNDAGGWQRWFFAALALIVSGALLVWLRSASPRHAALYVGLAGILGGAVGNLVDRLRFGYVVDFIQVHSGGWFFPAFNVADAAITVGATLVILDALTGRPDA